MRAALLGLLAIIVAIAIVWWVRRSDDAPAQPQQAPAATSGAAPRGDVAPPAGQEPVRHVRRVDPEQRKQLAAQIAAARARARAAGGGTSAAGAGSGTAGDDYITVEQVGKSVKAALEEAIPLLASCYDEKRSPTQKTAAVQMVMYSDPSIGTVIDTQEMHDPDGNPLPRELDDCLRSTIEQLALPPLDAGGHLPLQYSFKFD